MTGQLTNLFMVKEIFIEFSNLEQKISKSYNIYEVFADPSRKE